MNRSRYHQRNYQLPVYSVVAGLLSTFVAQASPHAVNFPEKYADLFQSYCYNCHDSVEEDAGINLETLPFNISRDMKTAETWQKILNVINTGEMPPDDETQLPRDLKTSFLDDLSNHMVKARKVLSDSGGVITMRRLNRREYRNTVNELLGIEPELHQLPEDGIGGYDTVGTSQFISSDQIEQYLSVGRELIDKLFDDQISSYLSGTTDSDKNPQGPWKRRRQVEILTNENAKERHEKLLLAYRDAQTFLETDQPLNKNPDAKTRIANTAITRYKLEGRALSEYLESPLTKNGSLISSYLGQQQLIPLSHKPLKNAPNYRPPVKDRLPPGLYKIRFRVGIVPEAAPNRHFVELGYPNYKDLSRIKTVHVTGTYDNPQVIEIPIILTEEGPWTLAIRERGDQKSDTTFYHYYRLYRQEGEPDFPAALWVDWVEWEGPFEVDKTEILQKVNRWWLPDDSNQTEDLRARKILERFSRMAMRGTEPGKSYLDDLLAIFKTRREAGEDFHLAIRKPLSVILASPEFLYLGEAATGEQKSFISARELSIRLAYFLWSAPPDDELKRLAKNGRLTQPQILREQVDRMIADPRADNFATGFVHQWLHLDRLDSLQINVERHRDFEVTMQAAARQEVYQSFMHLLRGSDAGRLGNLLHSDYVIQNGLLAAHYGIDGVNGSEFRRVKLPPDSPRGGLLGMAAVHAMGSNGDESSPVERGVWVLRYLLNDPPPPAPPNVPQLSEAANELSAKRLRVAAHQEEAQCANCHRKIDPIGFGMENFDVSGKWREFETRPRRFSRIPKHKWEIDPSGKFHNGPAFKNFFEMRSWIADQEDAFARGFTEHLLEYALGRPFGLTDEELANDIVKTAKKKDYAIPEFLQAVIASEEFRSK